MNIWDEAIDYCTTKLQRECSNSFRMVRDAAVVAYKVEKWDEVLPELKSSLEAIKAIMNSPMRAEVEKEIIKMRLLK